MTQDTQDVICLKVQSMLSLYIDNKLSDISANFVSAHLKICPSCKEKYLKLKELIANMHKAYEHIIAQSKIMHKESIFNIREYEKFHSNVSPYLDNELSEQEDIDFREYLNKSLHAQEELRNAYEVNKAVQNSFKNFRNGLKTDLSKKIISRLKNEYNVVNMKPISWPKAAILAGLMLFFASGGYLLKEPIKDFSDKLFEHKKIIFVELNRNISTDLG